MEGPPQMTGKETILGRVREALRMPAVRKPAPSSAAHKPHEAREWLPAVGDTFAAQLELFQKNAEALKARFISCASLSEALDCLAGLAAGWKSVGMHRASLLEPFATRLQDAGVRILYTDGGYAMDDLEATDAGVTTCECLVAQTGSVLVTSASSGGRALSVLPPHHVVLARREQLLPDLTAAFELTHARFGSNFPSMLSFITGPSRTGDIERILVLGAHGPKELTILLLP